MQLSDDERLRRFEALVHASPDFIAIADTGGQVAFLNAAGRALVGLPDDVDVATTSIPDYLTPEGLRRSLELEQPAVLAEGTWTGETTLRHWADSSEVPVSVRSFLLTDVRTGEPLAMATIQRDLREAHAAAALARAALQDTERRQQAMLEHLPDLLLVVGADGSLQHASPSAAVVVGAEHAHGLLGEDAIAGAHPADRERLARALEDITAVPGLAEPLLLRLRTAGGGYRDYEALANNLLDDPAVRGIVVLARDVTERLRAERSQHAQALVLELMAAEAPVETVLAALTQWVEGQLEQTACSILLTGSDGRSLRNGASPSMPPEYRQAVEASAASILASPCAAALREGGPVLVPDLLADERWEPLHEFADQLGVRSCWSFPVTSPATGATLGTFALYRQEPGLPDPTTAALIDRASHLVGITVDRHLLLERLEHQAHHDALTGLPNRLTLIEQLTGALARSAAGQGPTPVVVFLDLDRLKIINDSLGHEVGDELLVAIADRLRAATRPGELVARFGGDEFVVLSTVVGCDAEVEALVEGVLATVSQVVVLEGRPITPAASAGVVVAAAGQTASEVLRDGDIAMYRAKNRGGAGFALFGPHMRQRVFDRLDLEAQIRHGIAHGEFRVHYQPVVDLADGDRVVGFEALVRWQHPDRGLLSPAAFIELAEETGLVVPLGEQVLREAVRAACAWADRTPTDGLTMSVNLSARQLKAPGLAALVRECRKSVEPWALDLELTESTLMDDTAAVRAVVADLTATGASLSIDDFGTGYSSLAYLTRLPVLRLKIDRSFVADLDHRPEAATVAAAVISLGGKLGLKVVAEGIETAEQRATLLAMGCRFAQGYLFRRPVPEDEALALLLEQAGR